jgi:hypothetical protein
MIDLAEAVADADVFLSPKAAVEIPGNILATGNWTPILPVEQSRTSSACNPSAIAVALAVCSAARRPGTPVQALALPLLSKTARALPFFK